MHLNMPFAAMSYKSVILLPSVSHLLMKKCTVSRDTVFKAYSELKDRGLVESIPNKGYYVARQVSKVFLFLDTFKAYKEVLYGAFRKALAGKDIPLTCTFHHYNIRVFEDIIQSFNREIQPLYCDEF
jgi:DNA-binding transcriptional MocR family regulator